MKGIGRKLRVLGFVVAWTVAPGFPAIVCALTLPTEAHAATVSVPKCHETAPSSGAVSERATAHRDCCDDARTSCCLRALDIDGALAGVLSIDLSTILAPAITLPAPPTPALSLPLLLADARSHAPPGSHFRVLRL